MSRSLAAPLRATGADRSDAVSNDASPSNRGDGVNRQHARSKAPQCLTGWKRPSARLRMRAFNSRTRRNSTRYRSRPIRISPPTGWAHAPAVIWGMPDRPTTARKNLSNTRARAAGAVDERIRQETRHASNIACRVQEVRVGSEGMTRSCEPPLPQRRARRDDEERQPDGERQAAVPRSVGRADALQ